MTTVQSTLPDVTQVLVTVGDPSVVLSVAGQQQTFMLLIDNVDVYQVQVLA